MIHMVVDKYKFIPTCAIHVYMYSDMNVTEGYFVNIAYL